MSLMVCRICMKGDTHFYTVFGSIKGRAVTDIILYLTGIKIAENDGLPTCVCTECIQKLEHVNELRETCIKSNEKFARMKAHTTSDLKNLTASEFEVLIKTEAEESYEALNVKEEPNFPTSVFDEDPIEELVDAMPLEIKYHEGDDEDSDKDKQKKQQNDDSSHAPSPSPPPPKPKSARLRKAANKRNTKLKDDETDEEMLMDDDQEPEQKNTQSDLMESSSSSRPLRRKRGFRIAHENAIEAVRNVRCCGCSVIFDTLEMLQEHSKDVHLLEKDQYPELPYRCENCCKTFSYEKSYNLHKNFYAKNSTCPLCSTKLRSISLKKKHISIVHGLELDTLRIDEAPIKCCACYQNFDNYDDLFNHAEEEHKPKSGIAWGGIDAKPFSCDVCFRGFNLENRIFNHKALAYQPRKFQCIQCGKAFPAFSMLKKHETLHVEGNKKYPCTECQSQFKTQAYLNRHMTERHSADHAPKVFLCPHCGKSFRLKLPMLLHVRQRHLDVSLRPFECLICKKRFNRKVGLERHMKDHLGVKPYKCRFCDLAFVYCTDCKRHEVKHTGIYPYHCDLCKKPFVRLDTCRKHQERCNVK